MRPSILVIDDEHNFREFLGEALETSGYNVSLAASAQVGVAIARDRSPDVVLLDQNLPDRPGLEIRSEEHTSELQSRGHLVCRLLLEKKNIARKSNTT